MSKPLLLCWTRYQYKPDGVITHACRQGMKSLCGSNCIHTEWVTTDEAEPDCLKCQKILKSKSRTK